MGKSAEHSAALGGLALMPGIMMFLWVMLLHIPRALADLGDIGETSGVVEALALSGADRL